MAILPAGKFLQNLSNNFSLQKLISYLNEDNQRLDMVVRIVNNTSTIVVKSTKVLMTEKPQLIEAGEIHTNSEIIACQ